MGNGLAMRRPSGESPTQPRSFMFAVGFIGVALAGFEAVSAQRASALGLMIPLAMLVAVAALIRPALAAALLAPLIQLTSALPSYLVLPIVALALAELALGRARVSAVAPLLAFAAFALWAFASVLWTPDASAAARQYEGLGYSLAYLLAAAALITNRDDFVLVGWAFACTAAANGLFGIAGAALGLGGTRADGLTGDPNIFAMYEVMAIPFFVAAAAWSKAQWKRRLASLGLVLVIAGVLLSVSRGGALALAVVLLLMVVAPADVFYRSRRHKRLVVVGLVLVAGVGVWVAAPAFSKRVSDNTAAAGDGRIDLWHAALTGFSRHPVRGLGFGGFYVESNQLLRETPGVDLKRFPITRPGLPVHNEYISALAELGIIGAFLLCAILLTQLLAFRRIYVRARLSHPWFFALAPVVVGLSLAAVSTASVFLSTQASYVTFWLGGCIVALLKLTQTET